MTLRAPALSHSFRGFILSTLLPLSAPAAVPSAAAAPPAPTTGPADRVYRNGVVFTADAANSFAEALAIRDGRIVLQTLVGGLVVYEAARRP